ncbi:MAG: 50S ribosomal protein L13 [Candidatus Yonathbacteria bacterium]|nr:50S ribosomal protein L13 [Candidatus Yonathbacteria bacterium]
MEYTIDANQKSLGRVASQAAVFLMGKNTTTYKRHLAPAVKVHIVNASKVKMTPQKLEDKIYKTFSGYPGGQKEKPMKEVIEHKGYAEIFRLAVRGMLPTNKLRSIMMKNLEITE